MIIAINCRLNKAAQPEGYDEFLQHILNSLTTKFSQHRFLYIFDKPYPQLIAFAENVTPIVTGPETKTVLRLQYWLNYTLPAVLRKHHADVFVSLDGTCSLRTKIPQCLLIPDLNFLQQPPAVKRSLAKFYKKYTPAFMAKAKAIATVSAYTQQRIAGMYATEATDIALIHPVADAVFKPMDWEAKEPVMEKYSNGKAYFLYSGRIDQGSNIINLLKAFTFFKQRQKSNMQLVIAGNADEGFKKELGNYRLRNEVVLLENLSRAELAAVTAAAYAMIYPVLHAGLALNPLQAMRAGVPVVAANSESLTAICGAAAIYCNPADVKDMAENMMLLFKDEDMAARLVRAGHELIKQYDQERSADMLMQCIVTCTG